MIAAILVDTHLVLWARIAPERLTAGERRMLDTARSCYVTAVSLWEIANLMALDRIARTSAYWWFQTASNCFRCCPTIAGHWSHCRSGIAIRLTGCWLPKRVPSVSAF